MIRIVAALALAGTLFLSADKTPSWAQSAPAQAVKDRQEIMKGLWPNYYRDMARAARGESTDLASIATKASQAGDALKKAQLLFSPGTGRDAVPDTRAKPEVWTQKAEFDAAMVALIAETNAMGDTAKSGNAAAIKTQWAKIGEACGACHGGPTKSGGKFRFEE
jgi:cytochrome c556